MWAQGAVRGETLTSNGFQVDEVERKLEERPVPIRFVSF